MEQTGAKDEGSYFCYYLVAFIDLLGQKEELLNFTKLPDENNDVEVQAFKEQFRKTYGKAKAFYDNFDVFFKLLYHPDRRIFTGNLFTVNIKYKRFADGVAIYLPLRDSGDNIPVEEINGILLACASTFINFLSIGIPIRGGIDIGLGFEIEENDLYGPAVVKAYSLESKVAKYPRVIIGDGLMDYLHYYRNNDGSVIRDKINKEMADKCIELIVTDHDGYPILDYMGEAFDKATNHFLDFEVFQKACYYARQEHRKWKEKRNSKLAFRYRLMLNYLESRLSILKESDRNGQSIN